MRVEELKLEILEEIQGSDSIMYVKRYLQFKKGKVLLFLT